MTPRCITLTASILSILLSWKRSQSQAATQIFLSSTPSSLTLNWSAALCISSSVKRTLVRFLTYGPVLIIHSCQVQLVCGGWDSDPRPKSVADVRTYISQLKSAEPIPDYVFQLMDALDDNDCDSSATYTDVRFREHVFPSGHRLVKRVSYAFFSVRLLRQVLRGC